MHCIETSYFPAAISLYADCVRRLFSFPGRGITTFARMRRLDEKLSHPHRAFRSIHIGGTNGKGSVALKIAAALQEEGFCVGLYTSPHLLSVRERIRINGEMIPIEAFAQCLKQLFTEIDEDMSFFDVLTMAAFLLFRERGVDFAVIEVGLGGRLDATNVIDPILSVITSIGYDHTELLGDTLEKIAREKGGIVKPGVPLIAGPTAAPFFPYAHSVPVSRSSFYDQENSSIARTALLRLGVSMPSIVRGLSLRPRCRFERYGDVIIDAAHNPDGFQNLLVALLYHFPGEKFHYIVGFSRGKEWEACIAMIQESAELISFVSPHPRLLVFGSETMEEALAKPARGKKVICGSFYLMRKALALCDPEKRRELGAVNPSVMAHIPGV